MFKYFLALFLFCGCSSGSGKRTISVTLDANTLKFSIVKNIQTDEVYMQSEESFRSVAFMYIETDELFGQYHLYNFYPTNILTMSQESREFIMGLDLVSISILDINLNWQVGLLTVRENEKMKTILK